MSNSKEYKPKKTSKVRQAQTTQKSSKKDKPQQKQVEKDLLKEFEILKEKHPDAILIFRKSNHYLAINEDAVKVSETVGTPLIQPKRKQDGEHSTIFHKNELDTILPKMIRAGHRIAIVDAIVEEKKNVLKEERADVKQPLQKDPQLTTVNGDKISHAHAFQSDKNPDVWFFTAKMNGKPLHTMIMQREDVVAYNKREISIQSLMEKYYPTKMEKKLSVDEFKAGNVLSDGKAIERFFLFKENKPDHDNYGKWKAYVEVGGRKMVDTVSLRDLNGYFDRITTPAKIVENTFGAKLHLASAYQKYMLPEGIKEDDVRISKDKDGKWKVSVNLGEKGATSKKALSFDDGQSFFKTKTATRGQLAAKYLMSEMQSLLSQKTEQSRGIKI